MSSTYPKTEDVIELTKRLISLPSYVDDTHNESRVVDFLITFFKERFPSLTIEQQFLDDGSGRSNVLIKGKNAPRLFVLGHIDTVRPKDNWLTDPTTPTIQNNRLYGLGASDMKGSLAAFLTALVAEKELNLDDLMILMYCDEEYDFAGIKRFLETQELSVNPPELILSLDGSLTLSSGCRGLIEFNARVTGKSGHSSNPRNGKNVIMRTVAAVNAFETALVQYDDEHLGISTVNLAYLQGGIVEQENGVTSWQREGNVIPDYADLTVEVRTANKALDAAQAISLFNAMCKEQGVTVETTSIRHDLQPWPVSYGTDKVSMLKKCYQEAEIEFQQMDRTYSGFIDVQMVSKVVDAPTFVIGAGGENKHGANENVALADLTSAEQLYRVILIKSIGTDYERTT